MAHQAHAIPWHTLSSNLKFTHSPPRNHGITNLYLRKGNRDQQVKQLHYFIQGFVRALESYAAVERLKYDGAEAGVPELDEVVVSDEAARKMQGRVLRRKSREGEVNTKPPIPLSAILTPRERTARRFARDTEPGEGDMCGCVRGCCEVTKALVLHGEMECLFGLARRGDVFFERLWDERLYANARGFGLRRMVVGMLSAYVCLNVLVLFPEIWDPGSRAGVLAGRRGNSGREKPGKGDGDGKEEEEGTQLDYRLTSAYQSTLLTCTSIPPGAGTAETHTFPHRAFFGVPRGMFVSKWDTPPANYEYARWQQRNLGTQTVEQLMAPAWRGVYRPVDRDIPAVRGILAQRGLPNELVLNVMQLAGYVSVGRLCVPDDPLHSGNREELEKYLGFCWKVLVRVDLLWKEGGGRVEWEGEVGEVVRGLFGGLEGVLGKGGGRGWRDD